MLTLKRYLSTWFDFKALHVAPTNQNQDPTVPFDLVEEILSWVPATSLVRLRYTCKQWKTLIADPRFVNKHLSRMRCREQQSTVFNDVSTVSPSLGSTVSCVGIDFNELCLNVEVFEPVSDIFVLDMFHCDGLLLLVTRLPTLLVLMNPLLKKATWIKCGSIIDHYMDVFGLGHIYNDQFDYKMVRFRSPKGDVKVEVYDFTSDSWKVVVDINTFVGFKGLPLSSVCLRGTPYWIGYYDKYYGKTLSIQSFDFSKERFETLFLFPNDSSTLVPFEWCDSLSLGVFRGDHLSLVHGSRSAGEVHMWVMKKHWTKLITVAMPLLSRLPRHEKCWSYFFENNGKPVISIRYAKTGSISFYFVGEDHECQKVEYYSLENHTIGGCHYVPSLLQISRVWLL